jgi:hypothetical protein
MKRTFALAAAVVPYFVLACSADAPSRPEYATELTAATAPLPQLLPEETMIAVEIRDLTQRWPEIRSNRLIAELQNRVLEEINLEPDHLPAILGDRAVFALVLANEARSALPVALLLPPDVGRAEALLASIAPSWTVLRARGALWFGPTRLADRLKQVALGDGSSLAQAIPLNEVDQRLPAGGLVRGWVNPAAIKRAVGASAHGRLSAWLDLLRGVISAELDAVRWIGFRRDIEAGRITADAIVTYRTDLLPLEFSEALNPGASSPHLPARMPDGVAIAAAFRLEAQVALPWLRYLAANDPDGPLRNLEFWLKELEGRSGLDLEHDLFSALGEHGWLLVLESVNEAAFQWAIVLEATDATRVENALLSVLDWGTEQAWTRTLGLAVPKVQDNELDGRLVHTLVVSTPLGKLAGPLLSSSEGYLLIAAGSNSMRSALRLVENAAFSTEPRPEARPEAQGSIVIQGPPLARLVESMLTLAAKPGGGNGLFAVMADLVANAPGFAGNMFYETDAVRLSGEVSLYRQ